MVEKYKYKSLKVSAKLHQAIKLKATKKNMSIISFLQYVADKKEV